MAPITLSPSTFIILSSLLTITTSTFIPNTSYFLNCGAKTNLTLSSDNPSRVFLPDSSYLLSSSNSNSVSVKNDKDSSNNATLYGTARLFTGPATYRFPLSSSGILVVRLHFFTFPANDHNLLSAHFDVSSPNGFVLLHDFSFTATKSPVIKEYFVRVDGEQLDITFTPIGNNPALAFVNAIEVFTAPAELDIGEITNGITLEESNMWSFETVYRLNVGGELVTPHNDTLWRTWRPDEEFLLIGSASSIQYVSPNQVKYTPEYTEVVAPQSVYDSARTLNATEYAKTVGNFDFNVTWNFTVDANYKYLIRLHFCDFISLGFEDTIYFNIYVGNESAINQQSRQHTNALSEVYYMDFAVEAPSTGRLFVSIGSSDKNTDLQTANAYLNGLEMFKVNNLTGQVQNPGKGKSVLIIIVGPVVGGGIVISILVILCLLMCKKRRRLKAEPLPLTPQKSATTWSPYQGARNSATIFNKSSDGSSGPTVLSNQNLDLQIPLLTIKAATNDFDEHLIIGTGGFGKVYKGILAEGTIVAVKRGSNQSQQGYPAFKAEIDILSQVRHKHLVSLIGYCDEQGERILVYEFMEKGTLRSYLYGSPDNPCLSWKQRLEICIGAASGLHYLHTGFPHSIIHRDIKTTNILLGENYIAKVSDFGLSKQGPSYSKTHVTTGIKGTFGYMDPQYVKTQKLSEKSDVYSFGVMLFEVLCARPVIEQGVTEEQLSLSEWALQWQKRGQLEKIIDQKLIGNINMNSMRKFGETAEKCLAEFGDDRPTFGDVLWNLEYALQLQQTQVTRGPLDDSQVDAPQISIHIVAPFPSNEVTVDEEEDEENVTSSKATIATQQEMMRIHLGHSITTESSVFSQLNVGEGR